LGKKIKSACKPGSV